jgi:hypothetical protein
MKRLALALLLFTACAEDTPPPPPATEADVLDACNAFHEAVCHRWADCEGWAQPTLTRCLEENADSCQLEEPTCWDAQAAALLDCAEDWSTRACEDADTGYVPCIYFCPTPPAP